MDDRELQEIKAAIDHGRAQAARGEGLTVVEAKQRTMASIMRVAAEQEAEQRHDNEIRANRDSLVNDLIAEIGPPSPEEAQAIDDIMASGDRIAKRDAHALRLLAD